MSSLSEKGLEWLTHNSQKNTQNATLGQKLFGFGILQRLSTLEVGGRKSEDLKSRGLTWLDRHLTSHQPAATSGSSQLPCFHAFFEAFLRSRWQPFTQTLPFSDRRLKGSVCGLFSPSMLSHQFLGQMFFYEEPFAKALGKSTSVRWPAGLHLSRHTGRSFSPG